MAPPPKRGVAAASKRKTSRSAARTAPRPKSAKPPAAKAKNPAKRPKLSKPAKPIKRPKRIALVAPPPISPAKPPKSPKPVTPAKTIEHARLREHLERGIATPVAPWKRWGPYVSERAWGTVREDYSPDGAAWDYFPHDQARSRAYRWGEDGLAAVCDRYQLLVLAMAFWNGKDPILKERLFGLVPSEANHGEDVKEYYFYLDSTPTHSYMKWLYKYPQEQYPYAKLIDENRARRGRPAGEYELLDTGLFDENRYFDIFVEYAKNDPEDLCVRVEIFNRGPEDAPIHVLPQLWFRNTWAWGATPKPEPVIQLSKPFSRAPKGSVKPEKHLTLSASDEGAESLDNLPFPYRLGTRYLYGDAGGKPLFTNNETHCEKVWGPHVTSRTPYVKDAFHRHVIDGDASAVNPQQRGTKACLHYGPINVPAGESVVLRLRLSDQKLDNPLAEVDRIVALRRTDADAFYDTVHPPKASEDERRVQRQALAGMLWSKQVYFYDADQWFNGDNPASPPPASRKRGRNRHWMHLNSMRVLSMPDKWEYPWFAAWDLAFHCVPLTLVDPEFAKQQLWLLMFEQFQHPSGQIPAYEWEFSDLNPPVQAWAVWRVYNMDRVRNGVGDRRWLEQCFHKLLLNFTWWVNKVDREGNNVFEGGFLGLDNITVLDRSHELPHGARLEQSDATGWMGAFCLSLMRIALELAHENRAYESLATKFFQHYVYVGAAMTHMGGRDYQLWDADDKFFYDVLRYADGTFHKFRVRSLVGLIPLYAVERLEEDWLEGFNEFRSNLNWFLKHRQDLAKRCVVTIERNGKRVHVLTIVDQSQVRHLMERIWDPQEFRSDHGLRSLSKVHGAQPFRFEAAQVGYEPAESVEMLKGGNSNWRGPIWFPTAFMLMESLRKLGKAYGADAQINSPVAGEAPITCSGMARGFADRMIALFTRDKSGRRPVHGAYKKFQEDPHWRDLILFYEYFHGDTGMGLGASHQTGWTGLVASMIDEHRR